MHDVPQLPRDAFDEVFAVDGGSTDGTVAYLRSQGIPIHHQRTRGLNGAYVSANAISTCDARHDKSPRRSTRKNVRKSD